MGLGHEGPGTKGPGRTGNVPKGPELMGPGPKWPVAAPTRAVAVVLQHNKVPSYPQHRNNAYLSGPKSPKLIKCCMNGVAKLPFGLKLQG